MQITNRQTWGRQSGLDSNITNRTPIGAVICFNVKLSLISVTFNTRPILSIEDSAICRNPDTSVDSLSGVSCNREIRTSATPVMQKYCTLYFSFTCATCNLELGS